MNNYLASANHNFFWIKASKSVKGDLGGLAGTDGAWSGNAHKEIGQEEEWK